MKADRTHLLSGNPLTRFAGAPPRGEHLVLALFALTLVVLALSACAPKPTAPASTALNCAQGFEALRARIAAHPGVRPAPFDPGDPFRTYNLATGEASWFVTEPGSPAHPAILMQQVTPTGLKNTGCAYGDRAAYDQLMAYLASLKAGRK